MNYIDQLLAEVDQKASLKKPEMVGELFDRISASMAGLTNMRQYVALKKSISLDDRFEFSLDNDGELTYHWPPDVECKFIMNAPLRLERKRKLAELRARGRGIRRLKSEILSSI